MKKIIILLSCAAILPVGMQAQFFNRIANAANNAAKNAVERNVERKVEEGIDKVFNPETGEYEERQEESSEINQENSTQTTAPQSGWTCPNCGTTGNTGKFCNECGTKNPEAANGEWACPACGTKGNTGKFCNECGAKKPEAGAPATPAKKTVVTEYAKCDFVPGDEVFFEDVVEGEQIGEFPSKWDLLDGNSEVAMLNGQQVITLVDPAKIIPLMKEPRNFLGDVFTLEMDFWGTEFAEEEGVDAKYILRFEDGDYGVSIHLYDTRNSYEVWWHNGSTGDWANIDGEIKNLKYNDWNHLAISFNKRALKVYVNGTRIASAPNVKASAYFTISNDLWTTRGYIKNLRIAKGAVPLYNRLASDGKIVTYAITFEVGKADLKPESMVEIARIAKLMNDDPSINFEVQGHCDNSGSDKVNDPLSQKRAEAIVAALVGQGIAANRLTAVGKGSHSPLADNSTDEGRAKNRRVEFVKK